MRAHKHTPDEEAAELDDADVGERDLRRRCLHLDVRLNLCSLRIQMGLELEQNIVCNFYNIMLSYHSSLSIRNTETSQCECLLQS